MQLLFVHLAGSIDDSKFSGRVHRRQNGFLVRFMTLDSSIYEKMEYAGEIS